MCYRSGFNQPRKKANVEHPRDRKSVRCGCDAKLYLTKEVVDGVTQWYVSQFSNIHNHELLEDDQVRLLPAYRKIQEADQERILLLSKAGFPVNRIVKVLELEKGVQPGQLPFIEKDVRNFVRTCKKTVQENDVLLAEKRENDMFELLDACKATSPKDEGFVYNFTTDENGKVENIAWAYGQSVRAFAVFGDVVTFDTTYHSITYNLLLGIWFGIDNNGKPVLLGCVLLQDETSQSFSWAIQVCDANSYRYCAYTHTHAFNICGSPDCHLYFNRYLCNLCKEFIHRPLLLIWTWVSKMLYLLSCQILNMSYVYGILCASYLVGSLCP